MCLDQVQLGGSSTAWACSVPPTTAAIAACAARSSGLFSHAFLPRRSARRTTSRVGSRRRSPGEVFSRTARLAGGIAGVGSGPPDTLERGCQVDCLRLGRVAHLARHWSFIG